MRRKVGIAVAAMIVASQLGSPALGAPPSFDQLSNMAAFLEANDIVGLRAYLMLNPELLEGDGTFAATMRGFMSDTQDVGNYLGFKPDVRDAIAAGGDDEPADTATDPPSPPAASPITEGPPGY